MRVNLNVDGEGVGISATDVASRQTEGKRKRERERKRGQSKEKRKDVAIRLRFLANLLLTVTSFFSTSPSASSSWRKIRRFYCTSFCRSYTQEQRIE